MGDLTKATTCSFTASFAAAQDDTKTSMAETIPIGSLGVDHVACATNKRAQRPIRVTHRRIRLWHVAHFQRDLIFDALVSAPDAERDHWFWTLNNKPLTATKADVPSAAEFPGDLPYPDLDRAYNALIRVALHGASDLGHHTVLKLNAREVLVDTVWGTSGNGMIDFLGEFSVDRSHLKDGRNRILLQVFADQAKFDLMWFNWFEVGYFRRYVSHLGYLEASHPASEGHQIAAQKFTHPHVEIFELKGGMRLNGCSHKPRRRSLHRNVCRPRRARRALRHGR